MLADLYRIRRDTHYRIKLLLSLSLILNLTYSIFLFIISQVQDSKWFFVMSMYYGSLSIIRFFIFLQLKKSEQRRLKINTARFFGYFLLLINIIVSIMMFILIFQNQPVKHHEITVIALATYTFFMLTTAVISCIKFVRRNELIYTSIKVLSLISASVSLVTLTNTMLATFGEDNMELRSIILPILCSFVSVFIIITAFLMIRKTKENSHEQK